MAAEGGLSAEEYILLDDKHHNSRWRGVSFADWTAATGRDKYGRRPQ